MEKFPHYKVIGSVEEKHKKQREEELAKFITSDVRLSLNAEELDAVRENEIAKTPEQEALFVLVDEYINGLMRDLDLETFEFPTHNIFIIKKDKYAQISPNGTALADMGAQRIFLKERTHNYKLASALFHEMMHIKGRIVVQLFSSQEDHEKIDSHIIRAGLGTFSPQRKRGRGDNQGEYLVGIEEAVVARQQAIFNQAIRGWDEFSDVRDKFQSDEGREELKKIKEATGTIEEDVIWFDQERKTFDNLGYAPQRAVLDYVCEEISNHLDISFDDVHREFLRSHFTGHLVGIAKMVEQVFGVGSFRILASMPIRDDKKVQEIFAELKNRKKQYSDFAD